jgi:hypothetical protein
MNSQNNITKKSKRHGEKIWIKLEFNIIASTNFVTFYLCSPLDFWPPHLYGMQTKSTCSAVSEDRVTVHLIAQPIGAGQLEQGIFCFSARVPLKSWNRPWNCEFLRFYLILIISLDFNLILFIFNFFQIIQHVKYVLTCKII